MPAGAVVGGVAERHRSKVAKQANQDAQTKSYERAFASCMDFGVAPLLGDAATATDLSDLFTVFP